MLRSNPVSRTLSHTAAASRTKISGIRAGEVVYDGPVEQVTQEILDSIYNGASIPKAGE